MKTSKWRDIVPDDDAPPPAKGPRYDLITQIVSAYVGHNQVPLTELGKLISSVAAALGAANGAASGSGESDRAPAVNPKKSITDDFIICLEDGKRLKMLKRYLRSQYGLSPDDYRRRWGLPADYPMVAPSYSKQRSSFAKSIGLGTVPRKGPRGPKKPK